MNERDQQARLLAAIATLQRFAESDRARHELDALSAKLQASELNLVMLGQFKRGKSSLINALLGEPLLPTALVPLTAIVTEVHYGTAHEARIEFQDGRVETVPVGRLVEYVTEPGNPANIKGVARAKVFAPAPLLRGSLRIVDTPGIGSTYEHNTAVAREYVPWADAALFVLSVDPPIGELELGFLKEVARFTRRLLVILNKIDLYSPELVDEAIAFTRRTIGEFPIDLAIYPVSASLALTGKQQQDDELICRSQLPALEAAIDQAILGERERLVSEAVAAAVQRLAADAARRRQVALAALDASTAELERRLAIYQEKVAALRALGDERNQLLQLAATRVMADVVESDLAGPRERLERLADGLTDRAGQVPGGSNAELVAALERWTVESIRSTVVEWLIEEEPKLRASVIHAVERFAAEIARASRELEDLSSDLFALPRVEPPAPVVERIRFRFTDEPVGIEMMLSFVVEHLPRALARRLILRQARTRLLGLADRHAGVVRYAVRQWLEAQFAEQRHVFELQLEDLISSVEAGISTALTARERGANETAAVRAGLGRELEQIKRLIGELAA